MELKNIITLKEYFYKAIDEGKTIQIIIRFRNNNFVEAIFPFKNFPYTREQWKILKEIEEEISWIERVMGDREIEQNLEVK